MEIAQYVFDPKEQIMSEKIGNTFIVAAVNNMRSRMAELYTMADEIGKRHLGFVMAENKRRTWEEKSVLFVTPRLRDNTLTVTWYVVRWYGSKAAKTRRMEKKVIVKPKNKHTYNMETLLKFAKPWEIETTQEVEREIAPIRREAEFIAPCLGKLNKILRVEKGEADA